MTQKQFTETVKRYYAENKRDLPWRKVENVSARDLGYRVVVSEYMLQQTQVKRVIPKYNNWMSKWPTLDHFMHATIADVLTEWSGLGYNRRAKYLHTTLQQIADYHDGFVPQNINALTALPGIGVNTAAAIIVYTYNLPQVFIETNIRSVYLHSFFPNTRTPITDREILDIVSKTIDNEQPRQWYYALMDYGAYIKKTHESQLSKSLHYKRQPAFKGSNRQVRGRIMQIATQLKKVNIKELQSEIQDSRFYSILEALQQEGLIEIRKGWLSLPE